MESNLTQYKGPLTPAQASEGISLARANAARLIADAQLLVENNRYASATALAILAIEELGKVQAIKIIVRQSDAKKLKEAWRDYRNHRAKNVQWILPKLAAEGARTFTEVRSAADPGGDHTAMLDNVKQLSFYTDSYGSAGRWSEPSEAIDPKLAISILATAQILNRQTQTTERELELWTTVVGPHYGKPTMIEALLDFQKQVFNEGLSATSAEEMESFITGRPVGAQTSVSD
ncbi:AbiV family abortive infection protein [Rhizobium glycinendophyticum]|uniref:AbiV family abortive infection protein n=1 Tax=Rhizobium glycinendophyticum TaxID=2589807 RepID=A0A504UMH8_9HYPH|nr:AbiV family abortive infection protein [Rhizobium glycinendophyticum]TPP06642.1 AbiV family abortive infection protein [Rhizobium glycinendophyticum]